jgi:CRP-like cAMP-binding protein
VCWASLHIPTGFNIVERGEPASALFLLLSGHADFVSEDAQGNRTLVTRLQPGQFLASRASKTSWTRSFRRSRRTAVSV